MMGTALTSVEIVRRLLRQAVAGPQGSDPALTRDVLAEIPRECWAEVLAVLAEHRMSSLAGDWLQQAQLAEGALLGESLSRALEASRNAQTLLELTLASLGPAWEKLGLEPLVFKGVVLARDYYPRRGMRPMSDIDLWLPERAVTLEQVTPLLAARGFEQQADPRVYRNANGVALDVHSRLALFEDRGLSPLELSVPAQGGYRVFLPEPMLVHLVVHLLGHAREVGILLCWLADVAVVLQRHGAALNWEWVRQLCPDDHCWSALLRIVRLLVDEGWCTMPAAVAADVQASRAVSFEMLLRLRRIAPWAPWTARGWARMLRAFALPATASGVRLPSFEELQHGLPEVGREMLGRAQDGGLMMRPD